MFESTPAERARLVGIELKARDDNDGRPSGNEVRRIDAGGGLQKVEVAQ